MKVLSIIIFLLSTHLSSTMGRVINAESENIKVYVFLHESCIISQFYTLTLKELHDKYSREGIVFEGVFPNPKTKNEDLESFKEKHDLSFNMIIDSDQLLTKKLGATITPEVIVYNIDKDEIIYRGRIDDSYFRVGKRKRVSTTSELKDVLEAINNDEPVNVEFKDAIGCFISKI